MVNSQAVVLPLERTTAPYIKGQIWLKIGPNWSKIDPKGQNHIGREPDKTFFTQLEDLNNNFT